MNMKKIIYYTHIYFLDVALEVVGQLAQHYEVYLYIELAPESLHANIFNLDTELKDYDTITPFEQVKDSWNLGFYKPYFEKLKAVNFVVFGKNRSISLYAWRKSFAVRASFRKVKADYIHYDDFSIRQLWMVPFFTLNKKRFVLNVHDPKPHSGEKSLKRALIKRAIFRAAGRFVCFSEYSRTLLGTFEDDQKITDLRLTPYTFYRNYIHPVPPVEEGVTFAFVGRLATYKGIDLFMEAAGIISDLYPETRFIIAGKPVGGYVLDTATLPVQQLDCRIRHIENEELVAIIGQSDAVVCPYRDATQSGVIMTAYALHKPVIVSPVGGLPEYVDPGAGLVMAETTGLSLSRTMEIFIRQRREQQSGADPAVYDNPGYRAYNVNQFSKIYK